MQHGRAFVDMGNLGWNRTKEIARNHPSSQKGKSKGHAGSSSQTRDDFETDYHQRDVDAMSDEQLRQLLSRGVFQQHDVPEIEDELEDDDAEEDPPTAEGEGHDTPDDEEEAEDEDEDGSSQPGKKDVSPTIDGNFKKVKDKKNEKWYTQCQHCPKIYSLGISEGYSSLKRHLQSKHPVV
ncbi:unnamed protein product [Cuscuta europaea]|uniref:BED-type domain-containing protein n=1 Tax=Cuscuta europaea TaxID=41803 RepID=A0A9P0YNZ3_CUSEU|nr:unnamed protein product [Cuscuta europaea]